MKTELILKEILQSKRWAKAQIIESNGVYFPKGATGNHMNWAPHTNHFKNYMGNLLEILNEFHKYTEERNVLYSLNGGTLMGYYWNGSIMPWDDDIDVWLSEKDYFRTRNDLWKKSEPLGQNRQERKKSWKHTRIIKLGEKKYEIACNTLSSKPWLSHLTKLIPLNMPEESRNIGGLDIGMCRTCEDKTLKEGWHKWRPCFIAEDPSEKDFPIVEFSGIKSRAVVRSLGEPILDEVYGVKWRIPCHPKMKKNFDITPYL